MNYCKDCNHHQDAHLNPEKATCTQYIRYTSPVTGEKDFDFCYKVRGDANRCGLVAQFFQPKSGD